MAMRGLSFSACLDALRLSSIIFARLRCMYDLRAQFIILFFSLLPSRDAVGYSGDRVVLSRPADKETYLRSVPEVSEDDLHSERGRMLRHAL